MRAKLMRYISSRTCPEDLLQALTMPMPMTTTKNENHARAKSTQSRTATISCKKAVVGPAKSKSDSKISSPPTSIPSIHSTKPAHPAPTNAERIRNFIGLNFPVGPKEISSTLSISYREVWGQCRPMVLRGLLLRDKEGRYSPGRNLCSKPSAGSAFSINRSRSDGAPAKTGAAKVIEGIRAATHGSKSPAKAARKDKAPVHPETIEEFLARGGSITRLDNSIGEKGATKYVHSSSLGLTF